MAVTKHAIVTPNDGVIGDRARKVIEKHGNKFIAVTEQGGTIITLVLDGSIGVLFNKTEATWEIVDV
jgi:hypothetical protein